MAATVSGAWHCCAHRRMLGVMWVLLGMAAGDSAAESPQGVSIDVGSGVHAWADVTQGKDADPFQGKAPDKMKGKELRAFLR